MTVFDHLVPRPADALLGLMAAFREDGRINKVDLGVGIYRTDDGRTPVMAAVRAAERRMADTQETKAYEGPRGNLDFCAHIERFAVAGVTAGVLSFATPGGCGALSLALSLAKRVNDRATAWVSDPTWPNHVHIAKTCGLDTSSYRYAAPADQAVDLDALLHSLATAAPGDVVIIQGPCHNPTGVDLSDAQWRMLGAHMSSHRLVPLIDIAYHGFAASLESDVAGIQAFLKECPDAMIAYSCSKNFGLYRERSGCLLVTSDNPKTLPVVQTHLADIARAAYSMPPAHGPAIVATILGDAALAAQWKAELSEMRNRMVELRAGLAATLQPRSNSYDPATILSQNGMFSQLPFVAGGVDALKSDQGIYIPGNGRINIAGLSASQIPQLAAALSQYL